MNFYKKIINLIKHYLVKITKFFVPYSKIDKSQWSNPVVLEKASRFIERHREIISDPLNQLIAKDAKSGYIEGNNVILHNGNVVPFKGSLAYYRDFSNILILNRGVHEPLEEYCFQELLKVIDNDPIMVELGAYWSHYSMWMLKKIPNAKCIMVEPDKNSMKCGKNNFKINNFKGEFINKFVSDNGFNIDDFVKERNINFIDLLHSDIQGYELEMLNGARDFLGKHGAKYLFISTHSNELHSSVLETLQSYGYIIEVSSEFEFHTTSSDGFILASSPNSKKVFDEFNPLGRIDILNSDPNEIVKYLGNNLSE